MKPIQARRPGGEDEDASQAMDVYSLHTMADGSIRGRVWTNDDEDLGVPSAEATWDVQYPDRRAMESRTGKSHVGVSGVVVEVILDGRKI